MAPAKQHFKSETTGPGAASPAANRLLRIAGSVALLAALIPALLLSAKHVWAISVAGCGQGGGCEWTLTGPYSRLLGVAVAYWGAGYFAAMLLLWSSLLPGTAARYLLWVSRAGAAASLGFVGLMVGTGHLCPWCVGVHIANLLFWLVVEHSRRLVVGGDLRVGGWRLLSSCLLAGLVIAVFQAFDWKEQITNQAAQHEAALKSLAAMPTAPPVELPVRTAIESKGEDSATATTQPKVQSAPTKSKRFGGRFWHGSRNPRVRIVLFHDYQCELCFQVEKIINDLLAQRSDLAVSVKQWPFDSACNEYILGANPHEGACLASRAAEAVGLVGGDSAFWRFHYWLVERGGRLDDQSLDQQVRALGIDPAKLREALDGPTIDSIIQTDIAEGISFGLKWTPMVFVNGYQVQGWNSPGALPAAIDRAAATAAANPRADDQPESAIELQVRAWQQEPFKEIPVSDRDHSQGDRRAPVTVVAFGDLTCPYNASFFRSLEPLLEQNRSVRFVFKDFPLDGGCNELVKREINPFGCYAARLAQATGALRGGDAYFKACQWLLANRTTVTSTSSNDLAAALGLAAPELTRTLSLPQTEQAVADDVALAIKLGVDTSPTIFVNGKRVSGWQTPGLLDRLVRLASRTGAQ